MEQVKDPGSNALRALAELRLAHQTFESLNGGEHSIRARLLEAVVECVADVVPALSEPLVKSIVRRPGVDEQRECSADVRSVRLTEDDAGFQSWSKLTSDGYHWGNSLHLIHGRRPVELAIVVIRGGTTAHVAELFMQAIPITAAVAIDIYGNGVVDTATEVLWRRLWSALDGQQKCNERIEQRALRLEAALNALVGV